MQRRLRDVKRSIVHWVILPVSTTKRHSGLILRDKKASERPSLLEEALFFELPLILGAMGRLEERNGSLEVKWRRNERDKCLKFG
jgi:hypothetical protein